MTDRPGVEVLAELDGEPVLLRQGKFLVASFHPELTDDTRVHERFLELVGRRLVSGHSRVAMEPFFGQNVRNNAVSNFSLDNFRKGVEEHRVQQRAGRSHLSRRPGLSAPASQV